MWENSLISCYIWHLWRQNTAVLRVYKSYVAIYCSRIYLLYCNSILPNLEYLLRTSDLKRQFSLISPSSIGSWANTSLLYFSYDAFTLHWNIYHSFIRKEKCVSKVPWGRFPTASYLRNSGWKWPLCLRIRFFLSLWGIIFGFKVE